MDAVVFGAVALCLVLHAIMFFLVFIDIEEDRSHGPHQLEYEIKHYDEGDMWAWKVWACADPEISQSGEAPSRQEAVWLTRWAARNIRDELVYGNMDTASGEIWL